MFVWKRPRIHNFITFCLYDTESQNRVECSPLLMVTRNGFTNLIQQFTSFVCRKWLGNIRKLSQPKLDKNASANSAGSSLIGVNSTLSSSSSAVHIQRQFSKNKVRRQRYLYCLRFCKKDSSCIATCPRLALMHQIRTVSYSTHVCSADLCQSGLLRLVFEVIYDF